MNEKIERCSCGNVPFLDGAVRRMDETPMCESCYRIDREETLKAAEKERIKRLACQLRAIADEVEKFVSSCR